VSKTLVASALALALGAILIACTAPEVEATLVGVLAVDEILNEDGTCAARPGYRAPREEVVYVSEDNAYHRPGCRRLVHRKTTCTSRQTAQSHGYHRCPDCRPA